MPPLSPLSMETTAVAPVTWRVELGAEGHDLFVGCFRGFARGGIRFRLFRNELGAEVRDLLGGRLCCFAGGGIGSVRLGFRHGLRQQVGELVA